MSQPRQHPRVHVLDPDVGVTVVFDGAPATMSQKIVNVSRNGFFMEGDSPVAKGEEFAFAIPITGSGGSIRGKAFVRWIAPKGDGRSGVGVELSSLDGSSQAHWEELLQRQIYGLSVGEVADPVMTAPVDMTADQLVTAWKTKKDKRAILIDGGRVVGLVGPEDLFDAIVDGKVEAVPLKKWRDEIECVDAGEPLVNVFEKLHAARAGRLVVQKQGDAVGILRLEDVVPYFSEYMYLQSARYNNFLSRSMSYIAHDLRTPINVIQTANDLLVEGIITSEQYRERQLPAMIGRSIDLVKRLSDDLLDLGIARFSTFEVSKQRFDLCEAIEEAVTAWRGLADEKGVALHLAIARRPLMVEADRLRLVQVFNNLISNAVKYSRSEETVSISLEQQSDDGISMTVQDNGPGMSLVDQQALFEDLPDIQTLPTAGERKVGLGLSIVKQIVQAHGGEVSVESAVGKGTTCKVVLPASAS